MINKKLKGNNMKSKNSIDKVEVISQYGINCGELSKDNQLSNKINKTIEEKKKEGYILLNIKTNHFSSSLTTILSFHKNT